VTESPSDQSPEETHDSPSADTADPMDPAGPITSSRFHWNRGGWIGAQFGVSCWLLPFGILVGRTDLLVGTVAVISCVGINALGVFLWSKRSTLSAYTGIQVLVGATAIVNAVVVVLTRSSVKLDQLPKGGPVSAEVPYAMMGLAPMLMLMFFLQKLSQDRHNAKLKNDPVDPSEG
jgi:hypothetical protein